MGSDQRRSKKNSDLATSSSSSDSESYEKRKKRHRSSSRHHKKSSRSSSRKKKEPREDSKQRRRRRSRKRHSSSDSDSESENEKIPDPEILLRGILEKFPDIANDLQQLLEMIDNGQAVDIGGLSDKALVKDLEELFFSLKLKKSESGVFLLRPKGVPSLEVVGPILCSHVKSRENNPQSELDCAKSEGDAKEIGDDGKEDDPAPRRRVIGPEMPSRELLAAAAELTEAETLLREADLEADDGLLIGPPPPAIVAEAESTTEAERFEEVARIAGADAEKPYDVLGVNWKMSFDNIRKRYMKFSLMVHPDKCPHPQAQEAFVKLNRAYKDLQDPEKRKAIDEKIKLKEEEEEFKAELKSLREAAQWRRLQGISLEGDEELLAVAKEAPRRDEWMTTLPPERKPGGMPVHTTTFSRTTKEGRGDTSAWTDGPLDKAQKAKQHYLEAYNRTQALADTEDKMKSTDADLVDKYNSAKRSMSLVQKHQEEGMKQSKKKAKKQQKSKKEEEWVGQHPWKPWDRENDLTAGRKNVNLDPKGMSQGLTSRFDSGSVQRNFL